MTKQSAIMAVAAAVMAGCATTPKVDNDQILTEAASRSYDTSKLLWVRQGE